MTRIHYSVYCYQPLGFEGETITKEAMDKAVADAVARATADAETRFRTSQRDTLKNLEQLQQASQLTQQEKAKLEEEIASLRKKTMTQEELAKAEQTKKEQQHAAALEDAKKAAEAWQSRYAQSTIQTSLMEAAVAGEAIVPTQVVGLLRHTTRLSAVKDADGKETGDYTVEVNFDEVDPKTGKTLQLVLSPAEAIKKMKENVQTYGNLFKGTGNAGHGGAGSRQPAGKLNMKDAASYREQRKAAGIK